MAEEKGKQFDFSEWLAEGLEGMLGSRPRLTAPLPPEFKQHTKAAFKEMLLAYRSLLDALIAKAEERCEEQAEVTKIKVD